MFPCTQKSNPHGYAGQGPDTTMEMPGVDIEMGNPPRNPSGFADIIARVEWLEKFAMTISSNGVESSGRMQTSSASQPLVNRAPQQVSAKELLKRSRSGAGHLPLSPQSDPGHLTVLSSPPISRKPAALELILKPNVLRSASVFLTPGPADL